MPLSFGAPHRHYRQTDSTNTRARELAAAGAPHGTIVTAAEQTEGRGRQGRTWTAPPGKALLYSAVLRPLGDRPLLPLAVALAVCEVAEDLAPGIACQVKWPNDVQVEGRKLAGILIEARPQDGWAVIGVGLNLSIAPEEFPPDLRETAVSIFDSITGGRGESRRSLPAVAPAGLPSPTTNQTLLGTSAWGGVEPCSARWRPAATRAPSSESTWVQ
jgi:biotin-[acetyl-CoA-carboxylase] ligase BirA-like protein